MLTASQAAGFAAASYGVKDDIGAAQNTAFLVEGRADLKANFDIDKSTGFHGRSGFGGGVKTGFGMLTPHKSDPGAYVLAVRGTDSSSKADLFTDGCAGLVPGPGGAPCHWGFAKVYMSIRSGIDAALTSATGSPYGFKRLDIVGHSLGGALANLLAIHYGEKAPVTLTTFGAPRVGTLNFNSTLRKAVMDGELRRIYDPADPIPMIPIFPYVHCGEGSIGLTSSRFTGITLDAHDMSDNYLQAMKGGWPAVNNAPSKGDVSYWISQANLTGHPFSISGLGSLTKALGLLLAKLTGYVVGIGLQAVLATGVSLVDQIAYILYQGARGIKAVADLVMDMVNSMLGWLGRKALAVVSSVEDITMRFLRWLLATFLDHLMTKAVQAIQRLTNRY